MAERLTPRSTALFAAALALAAGAVVVRPGLAQSPPSLSSQTQEQADAKSAGCMSCHTKTDQKSMHVSTSVRLGCTDCHDGEPRIVKTIPPPTAEETLKKGVLDALVPLVRWELGMPGNPFRVFERG